MAASRREFLLCAGCALIGCTTGAASDGNVDESMNQVTLPFAQFPKLQSAGGSVVVGVNGSFPIVVVRTGAADAVALSATCTHAACLVALDSAGKLHCPCHNANFDLAGNVLSGPTAIPLPVYRATVGADAIVVDLS